MFARQLRHELVKMFARRRTYIGFGAFLAVEIVILMMLNLPRARQGLLRRIERLDAFADIQAMDYFGGLTLGLMMVAFTFMLLGALYIALVAGDIVAKEVEDGTMRMILCRPVSRLRLLAIKWLACAIYTIVLVIFLGATALIAATIYRGGLGKMAVIVPPEGIFAMYERAEGLWRFARAILFLSYSVLSICSVAFMFSCFRMKPAAAAVITLSVFFVDMILRRIEYFEPYEQWFVTYHTASWVRSFHSDVPWTSMAQSWLFLGLIIAACWCIGAIRFSRRDLKN